MNTLQSLFSIVRGTFANKNNPVAISIDVTHKCNLRCKHCYFLTYNYKSELKNRELISKLKELKAKYPIMHASWIGGEPLLRKDLVEEGMRLFPFNMVVTNGTLKLPSWKNCVFVVSVDGTRKYYEKVRGKNYDLVKKNADRKDVKVVIACVLSKLNSPCIEAMVKEWSKIHARGIAFDFFTPIKGINDKIWLNWQERDKVIDRLLKLKKEYKGFVINSKRILNLMKSKNAKEILKKCTVPKRVYSIDPSGTRKPLCVLGNRADCSRCGCVLPYATTKVSVLGRLTSLYDYKKMFTQF